MLHFRQQDDVTCAQKFSAPRLRDQINALGRAARENNLLGGGRAEIGGDALPRCFVSLRRPRAQLVQTAMHIGIVVFIVIPERFDYHPRLLRGRRAVEVNQWMPMRPLTQDREILTDRCPSDAGMGDRVQVSNLLRASLDAT